MYKILLKEIEKKYEYVELIKVFLTPDQFEAFTDAEFEENKYAASSDTLIVINESGSKERNRIKREIFSILSRMTGQMPPWGILTGVRPVKLTGELYQKLGSREKVNLCLKNEYLVSDEKIALLLETCEYQQKVLGSPPNSGVGLYIGIPFCPTRCLYCSFPSNQKGQEEITKYLEALVTEIRYCGRRMRETGLWPESVYIGGGTPTTLSPDQLDRLLTEVETHMDLSRTKEFTVEAGRPDTITEEKLRVLKQHGIMRISINPQSMKKRTLEFIGRSHAPEDILDAFHKTACAGISMINADVIAGLPEETPEDFKNTMETIIGLEPDNITVHTLAVKRASRLMDQDPDYHYRQGQIVSEMLEIGSRMLREAGYRPYYLYRQKHMAGSFENVGYCKGDTPCIYNIRIMEEQQTIIALGAGGISKVYFPEENRLERVPNVTNYEVYIDRMKEMLERKEENLFKEVQSC
ncbi:MAG: coproporphyrinogen dehydrogenase HemZ [Anaerovoracaceae bacterium]